MGPDVPIASSLQIVETRLVTGDLERQLQMNENAIRQSSLFTGLGISEQERIQITKAMDMPLGHWFKCPNGAPTPLLSIISFEHTDIYVQMRWYTLLHFEFEEFTSLILFNIRI